MPEAQSAVALENESPFPIFYQCAFVGYHGIIYASRRLGTFHFTTFILEQANKTLHSDDYNAISVGYQRYDKCFESLVRDWTMIKCDGASLERCLCPSENEITSPWPRHSR
ncbi:hypothetical protein RHGRI_003364 [Rhododendron griersonianum]|uniref:Uncharacterized protein n=1 Tax=Rhododendron griersonianum TaxID=479676 RepID=A0AAV6L4Q8_9ERIC|nr:hypothetical protein RHGRI_003364 [Rhododendron griersonianum]